MIPLTPSASNIQFSGVLKIVNTSFTFPMKSMSIILWSLKSSEYPRLEEHDSDSSFRMLFHFRRIFE